MKYRIRALIKRIGAAIASFFMLIAGGGTRGPVPVRPAVNTVTAYDSDAADYGLRVDASRVTREISDMLFGVFMEDINFAADGGLYAEMVANRSFEFTDIAEDDSFYAWSTEGEAVAHVCENAEDALNENNTNYLVIENASAAKAGVANRGFLDGMAVQEGKAYRFSVYAKGCEGYGGAVHVSIKADGAVIGEGRIDGITAEWQKYETELISTATAAGNVCLCVEIDRGSVAVDMVSLFPEDTYKGRENGMRRDLAEMLEALNPAFLRFPGGCVIEGYDDETDYSWKDSIGTGKNGEPLLFNGGYGDVAARKQGINLWTNIAATDDPLPCFMSYGLGFYEYFVLAEDIGAVGVPVLNCGLYCQMRGRGPVEIDSKRFEQYVCDMLDLVEFCRGGEDTKWGAVRASLGHPEPFELRYIGIGNENEGEDYFLRYAAFLDAFNAAREEKPALYDGIELIYSAGAFDATHSENYIKSYEYAKTWLQDHPGAAVSDFAGATDHHYYNEPSWFLKNTDYYDEENYTRSPTDMTDTIYGGGIGVFLGEYAAKSNTLGAALAEAAYMTGLERNGDIVKMAAYAPLFGNLTATHWSPNLIWFNNRLCTGSVNYYVQKLFSANAGTGLLASELSGAGVKQGELCGRVGVGTWNTAAEFDNVKVVNNKTGEVLGQDSFALNDFWWNWTKETDGDFKVRNGKLAQTSTQMEYSLTGSVAYFGEDEWTDYTYTLDAVKTAGDEGFIIPLAVGDRNNNYFWNIGGWHNTVSCLQQIENGAKSGRLAGTAKAFEAETGRTYKLKAVVSGTRIKCYVDNVLFVDYETASRSEAEAYQVVSTDETGDIIIKLVNVTDSSRTFAVDASSAISVASTAAVEQVAGDSSENDNLLGEPEVCKDKSFSVNVPGGEFNYTVPRFSVTVIRLERQ